MTHADCTPRMTRIYTIDLPKGRTPVAGRVLVQLERGDLMFFPADGRMAERASVPPELVGVFQEWIASCGAAVPEPPLPERARVFLSVTFGMRAEPTPQSSAGVLGVAAAENAEAAATA